MDLYLIQHWKDPRLDSNSPLNVAMDLNDPNLVKAIWKPTLYFPNSKDAEYNYVTVPQVLVRLEPFGDVTYMLR